MVDGYPQLAQDIWAHLLQSWERGERCPSVQVRANCHERDVASKRRCCLSRT